ncbi:MAG: hypothetical protein QG657_2262 [Acidobacteriota bacterium]|nr:hypothetical protein [Acidobacteriota bacterium]
MIRLIRLYSEPEIFTPIEFSRGVNIILGERVGQDTINKRKTIGVGKSMCIEFINFCLLKKTDHSRVMQITENDLAPEVEIKLDLEINSTLLTISRTPKNPKTPSILKGGETIPFASLEDAASYLIDLLFITKPGEPAPGFREMLGPLVRDERSEFKDIIDCFDTGLRIPPNYIPHLYLLGIDLVVYKDAKEKLKELVWAKEIIKDLKKRITKNDTKKISHARAELNELEDEVLKMRQAIESFKTNEAFDSIQKDLVVIEDRLEKLRHEQKAIRYELKRIDSLPRPEIIGEEDIEIVYNQFKQGLGNMIVRSLEQVKTFKSRIENFQQKLVNDRTQALTTQLKKITEETRSLDNEYSEKASKIDQKGVMKDLKTSLRIYDKKNEELSEIRSLLKQYDAEEKKVLKLKSEKERLIYELGECIEKASEVKAGFNATISDIHELIMGNRQCSFNIDTIDRSNSKEVIRFEMRTFDDGSHSVERTKVFIYDMALLFNDYTRQRHPKIVIHDNIFDVDQDTLVQSLNFLKMQEEKFDDFQYILTLNRDKVENEERQRLIKLDISSHTIASFTKQAKFLRKDYNEM